jgi:hypothetical protein
VWVVWEDVVEVVEGVAVAWTKRAVRVRFGPVTETTSRSGR